jgi:isoleucyl-tRNA synthetase
MTSGLEYGLDAYSPVDDTAFSPKMSTFSRASSFSKPMTNINQTAEDKGVLLAKEEIGAFLPALLALQAAGDLPRHAPVVHLHGKNRAAQDGPRGAIDRVKWIPHWGRERIYGMIENRPDWCVSRQRAWGVPITVFICEAATPCTWTRLAMNHVFAFRNPWGRRLVRKDTAELLPEGRGLQTVRQFVRQGDDILDVWFDSGVSHAAVLEERRLPEWPADLYLEGSDQHRGWFHSALLTAVGTRGRSTLQSVLTHGFVVDAEGKKMSKSMGNVMAPKR